MTEALNEVRSVFRAAVADRVTAVDPSEDVALPRQREGSSFTTRPPEYGSERIISLPDELVTDPVRARCLIHTGGDAQRWWFTVVTVQRALAHATATTTLNTYSHLWSTAEDRTRAATSGLMRQAMSTPEHTDRAAT